MRTISRHFDKSSKQAIALMEQVKRTRSIIYRFLDYCPIPTSKIIQLTVRGLSEDEIYGYACDINSECDKIASKWDNRNKQLSF